MELRQDINNENRFMGFGLSSSNLITGSELYSPKVGKLVVTTLGGPGF